MRRALLAAASLALMVDAHAADTTDNRAMIRGCITAAAHVYRLPPVVLVILLNVEGGALRRATPNANGTVDIGPMQVNQIWLPEVAAHWHATLADTWQALSDDFCANVEAGAWILRRGLDAAHGDLWEGVGTYHSHDPEHKAAYLRAVLRQVLRLRALTERAAASRPPRLPASEPPGPAVMAAGN